jgi:hypothetical protein
MVAWAMGIERASHGNQWAAVIYVSWTPDLDVGIGRMSERLAMNKPWRI